MARSKKQSGSDEPPGAPEWMVTFSDCMTLLLTFFVLLLSFSSFDEEMFQELKVIFADAMPAVNQSNEQNEDAVLATQLIKPTDNVSEGSEKPTLEEGKQDGLKEEKEPVDFRSRKVFLVQSQKIFWAKGTAISHQGRDILAPIASFLKQMPSRVVISENGQTDEDNEGPRLAGTQQFGLLRAWAVIEYLVKKQRLDKNRFGISAASTLRDLSPVTRASSDERRATSDEKRMLEIVLLERSIYH